jgi:hypothetical protein
VPDTRRSRLVNVVCVEMNVMLAGRGHREGENEGEGVHNGAVGFEQGTSTDRDSLPWTKS